MDYIENYKIIIIDDKQKIIKFMKFLDKFYKYNKKNKNKFVSIDFEYHKHK